MQQLTDMMTRLGASPWVAPLWIAVASCVVAVLAVVGFYFLLVLALPKMAAVARTTAKEALVQPPFAILFGVGSFLLLASVFLPYRTFGEDNKMFMINGIDMIMILSVILALWMASVSISEEIEGRTALTLLSKPISRRQFVIGKFLGIIAVVAALFIVLGFVYLCCTSFKVPYDARESSQEIPSALASQQAMVRVLPGLLLYFMQAALLTSISVAVSTRLPMLANLMICFSVYILGHLGPLLVQSSAGKNPIVRFVGTLGATVLPVLDHFDVQAAISGGSDVPMMYVGWAFVYCAIYCTIALLLALAMFEDRDLA
jgi:ABC-type transport system involved in multi-copper enzyme maturation permease subunit